MNLSHYAEVKSLMDTFDLDEENVDSILNTIIDNEYEDGFDPFEIYQGDEFDEDKDEDEEDEDMLCSLIEAE